MEYVVDGWYATKIPRNSATHVIVNSFWTVDCIWWHRSWSILVMASCLKAPIHYLNQCWLLICQVLWYLPDSKGDKCPSKYSVDFSIENYFVEIITTSSRGQWVYTCWNQIAALVLSFCEQREIDKARKIDDCIGISSWTRTKFIEFIATDFRYHIWISNLCSFLYPVIERYIWQIWS